MKDLTKLTSRQISQIKNIYKANSSIYSRIETLQKHLYKIQEELDEQLAIIEANEAGVKMLTGGFISKQLIKDEQIPQFNEDGTPKLNDKTGYQIKTTKYVLKYPDTILPIEENNKVANEGCDPAIAEETVEAPVMDAESAEEVETPAMEDAAPFSL